MTETSCKRCMDSNVRRRPPRLRHPASPASCHPAPRPSSPNRSEIHRAFHPPGPPARRGGLLPRRESIRALRGGTGAAPPACGGETVLAGVRDMGGDQQKRRGFLPCRTLGSLLPETKHSESARRGASLARGFISSMDCSDFGFDVACESEEMDLKGKTGPVRSPAGGRTILRPDSGGYTIPPRNGASQMPRTGTGGRGVTMLSFKTFSFRRARNGPHLHPVIRTGRAPSDTPPWFLPSSGRKTERLPLHPT